MSNPIVQLDYHQLKTLDPTTTNELITKAFGFDGLGILLVNNVPNLKELRTKVLLLIKQFADLPPNIRELYSDPETLYCFGWSHGKEKMKKDTPDTMKGSFYFNPEYNEPFEEPIASEHKILCRKNIWPDDIIPGFSENSLELTRLIVEVGREILKMCDLYIKTNFDDPEHPSLEDFCSNSRLHKARLLHYFPCVSMNDDTTSDLWCGAHNDHGYLTGLVSSIYLNKENQIVPAPDPRCGLHIKSRSGETVKVSIPENSLAFQIGEAACIHSGGKLQATPHTVVAPSTPEGVGISRESLAVFLSAKWDYVMGTPAGSKIEDIFKGSTTEFLPEGIPLLSTRWEIGKTYEEFSNATFSAYYN